MTTPKSVLIPSSHTGYKNTLGSSHIYVLIPGINYTVDMRTVFQKTVLISGVFLYPECSCIRSVLVSGVFLYPECSYIWSVLISGVFLYPEFSYIRVFL